MPQSFVDFCKRAKTSKDTLSGSTVDQTFIQHSRVVGYAITEKPSELSGHVISNIYPSFHGANMIAVSIKPVSICHTYCKKSVT